VLYPRCAVLDVHEETVVASARLTFGGQGSIGSRSGMAEANFVLILANAAHVKKVPGQD
jgi:hypothetical protein